MSFCLFKWGLPYIVSNDKAISFIQNEAKKTLDIDIEIVKPKLLTGSKIAFTVEDFKINKNTKTIFYLKNIDTLFDLTDIFSKRIIVKKLLAEEIYADVDDLINLFPKQKKEKKKKASPLKVDLYSALLGVKKTTIIYDNPKFSLDFKAHHMIFDRTQERKFIHFDFDFDLIHANRKISVSANDANKFYMENKKAYIVNFPIYIDKSKIVINAVTDNKFNYELNINGINYNAQDIANAVESDIFVSNGSQMLQPITDINGTVNFNFKLTNNSTNGNIRINKILFKVKPLLNIPVTVSKGLINIDSNNIKFSEFEGFYNNKSQNTLKLKGETKDYTKTCATKLISDVFVTNDFFKNYLTKMLGSPVELVGDADSKLIIESVNGSLDVRWYFLLKEGEGFKFGDTSMVLNDYKTAFKVDLSVIKNILKINTIDYFITNELKRGMVPLITINGNLDMSDNMNYQDLHLNITKPLPSEFLNFVIGQKIFKKGHVSGNMSLFNHGKYGKLEGKFTLDKVLIPAQRMYIKSGILAANGDKISANVTGRIRRSNFDFDGYIINKIELPLIVKNMNLTLDNIDVERFLTNQQSSVSSTDVQSALVSKDVTNEENLDSLSFTKGLVVVEKCGLNLLNGIYKEIVFGNIHADMTLDKDGLLCLKSNRFDIAGGTSSLKLDADLVNKKFRLKLGIKDVDSNIMATAILGLPRQISGKAKGLIDINTDSTLKLNGDIKFKVNDGTIEQIGYVEYILKVASLFRNPLAMISPTTVWDLVSIPNGQFDEIKGEMKLQDNIITRMKIESTAPALATLIFGRYDLSTNDATLRIYTKFSDKGKGFASALRKVSLNAIASKISISARNESNYYASELEQIPKLKNNDSDAQVFLTKVDGDVINFNFLSSLKRIK